MGGYEMWAKKKGEKLMWDVLLSLQWSPGNSGKRVNTPELN
jgi:hypothetical protein